MVLQACKKEKLEPSVLSGKWSCKTITYSRLVGDTGIARTVLNESAFIDFTNEYPAENRGGTVYGDYASGRTKLPFVYGTQIPETLFMLEGRLLFTQSIEQKPDWSFRNKYNGLILFQPYNMNGLDYVTYGTKITLLEEDQMLITFSLSPTNFYYDTVKQNYFELLLIRES